MVNPSHSLRNLLLSDFAVLMFNGENRYIYVALHNSVRHPIRTDVTIIVLLFVANLSTLSAYRTSKQNIV